MLLVLHTRRDLVGIGTNGVIGLSYEGGQRVSSHASSLHLSFIGFPTTEDSIAPLPCFEPLTPLEKEGMAVFNLQIMSDLSVRNQMAWIINFDAEFRPGHLLANNVNENTIHSFCTMLCVVD